MWKTDFIVLFCATIWLGIGASGGRAFLIAPAYALPMESLERTKDDPRFANAGSGGAWTITTQCEHVLQSCLKLCRHKSLNFFCYNEELSGKPSGWFSDCFNASASSAASHWPRLQSRSSNVPMNLQHLVPPEFVDSDIEAMRSSFQDGIPLQQQENSAHSCSVYPDLCTNHSLAKDDLPSKFQGPNNGDYYPKHYYVGTGHQDTESFKAKLEYASHNFLRAGDFAVGSEVTIDIPPPSQKFLPAKLDHSVIAKDMQSKLLQLLSLEAKSAEGSLINETFTACYSEALPQERKACFTGLYAMMHFASSALSTDDIAVHIPWSAKLPEGSGQFTVVEMSNATCTATSAPVACHTLLGLPFAVYICHYIPHTKVYEVKVKPIEHQSTRDDSELVGTVLCHYDTLDFPASHISFQALDLQPGDTLCHWAYPDTAIFCSDKKIKKIVQA